MRSRVMTAMGFTGYRHSEDSVKLDIDTFYRRELGTPARKPAQNWQPSRG